MFAVYGYNKADEELCGCELCGSTADALDCVRIIFADILREDAPETVNGESNSAVLAWAKEAGSYTENLSDMTFETDGLVYCIEPVSQAKE